MEQNSDIHIIAITARVRISIFTNDQRSCAFTGTRLGEENHFRLRINQLHQLTAEENWHSNNITKGWEKNTAFISNALDEESLLYKFYERLEKKKICATFNGAKSRANKYLSCLGEKLQKSRVHIDTKNE